jgi:hypothetical protein
VPRFWLARRRRGGHARHTREPIVAIRPARGTVPLVETGVELEAGTTGQIAARYTPQLAGLGVEVLSVTDPGVRRRSAVTSLSRETPRAIPNVALFTFDHDLRNLFCEGRLSPCIAVANFEHPRPQIARVQSSIQTVNSPSKRLGAPFPCAIRVPTCAGHAHLGVLAPRTARPRWRSPCKVGVRSAAASTGAPRRRDPIIRRAPVHHQYRGVTLSWWR